MYKEHNMFKIDFNLWWFKPNYQCQDVKISILIFIKVIIDKFKWNKEWWSAKRCSKNDKVSNQDMKKTKHSDKKKQNLFAALN